MRVPFSVKVCTVAVTLLAAAAPAPAEAAVIKDTSAQDRAFVEAAGHGDAYEVASGHLAASKASDAGVRSFGQKMVTDHTKMGDTLTSLAGGLGLKVPSAPDGVQQKILDLWSSMSSASFDCSYAIAAYVDHVGDIGLFDRESADGQNSKLRAYARDELPTLREHRKMAVANLNSLSCGTGNNNGGPGNNNGGPVGIPLPVPWPTVYPTYGHPHPHPTTWPTMWPPTYPSGHPSRHPRPTQTATPTPTATRTAWPTGFPTALPTSWPTILPTSWPTRHPTMPPATMPGPTNVP